MHYSDIIIMKCNTFFFFTVVCACVCVIRSHNAYAHTLYCDFYVTIKATRWRSG